MEHKIGITLNWYKQQKENSGNFILAVHVKPKATQSKIVGISPCNSYLEVAIKAIPEDGAANAELVKYLASVLKISKSQCMLKSGHRSRYKQILVIGILETELRGISDCE